MIREEKGGMRTRRGLCYPRVVNMCVEKSDDVVDIRVVKRRRDSRTAADAVSVAAAAAAVQSRKRTKFPPEVVPAGGCDYFEALPDDLVLSILCKLSATASSAADFTNVLITYVLVLLFPIFGFFFMRE